MLTLKIEGGQQLAKNLAALSLTKERAVVLKMLKEAAEPMRAEAERLVPIGDEAPHLVDHIVVSTTNQSGEDVDIMGDLKRRDTEHVVAIGPIKELFYGLIQEYGLGVHAPHAQPFMRPAFDSQHAASLKVFQEALWAQLRAASSGSTTGRGL